MKSVACVIQKKITKAQHPQGERSRCMMDSILIRRTSTATKTQSSRKAARLANKAFMDRAAYARTWSHSDMASQLFTVTLAITRTQLYTYEYSRTVPCRLKPVQLCQSLHADATVPLGAGGHPVPLQISTREVSFVSNRHRSSVGTSRLWRTGLRSRLAHTFQCLHRLSTYTGQCSYTRSMANAVCWM